MTTPLQILIVDDDPRMTHTLADILSLAGHQAVEVSSAELAIEQVRLQDFDCVLTDVRMPGMDGVELHRRLRQARPGLPVVLMTAYASEQTLSQGLDEGVVGVLEKPLDMAQLLSFFDLLSRSHSIAIVDDDPMFCSTLGDILLQRGFKVNLITDPHTDIQHITSKAQTVLLDMKLNSISGLDILKEIRASYPTLPVLLITGYRHEMADIIEAALDVHAYACFYKPLEIGELLQRLTEIRTHRLREALHERD
ncbi:MAG: response regulator [Chloroflexota bacterium]